MRIVVPVCADDLPLACLNLKLAAKLDASCPFPCLISAPSGIDISELEALCSKWFASVQTFRYDDWKGERAWPRPQNWAWQETARFIPSLAPPLPWFWWEADATPLKKGWFKALLDGYAKAGKPFAGHIVGGAGNGHMNGVAIYPHDVRPYGKSAFITRAVAFDRMLSSEIGANAIAPLNSLIGHYLKPPGRLSYEINDGHDAETLVESSLVVYHGSSDGQLVRYLLDPSQFSHKAVQNRSVHISLLSYNRLDLTRACLEILEANTRPPYALTITDNASDDGSREWLKEWATTRPHVRVICNTMNAGYKEPHDICFAHALTLKPHPEFFVILNNDVELGPGWLQRAIAKFDLNPNLALVGNTGVCCNLTDGLRGVGADPKRAPEYIEGSLLIARVSLISKLGAPLFEPELEFIYCEDCDLSLRAREAGYNIATIDLNSRHLSNQTVRTVDPATKAKIEGSLQKNLTWMRKRWSAYVKRRDFRYQVLIRRSHALGDVLFSTPVIAALKKKWPQCEIDVQADAHVVFHGNPAVRRAQAKPFLSTYDYHFVLDLAYEKRPDVHPVTAYADVCGVKCPIETALPLIYSMNGAKQDAEKLLPRPTSDRWAVIHPGPTKWPGRDWDKENWESLVGCMRDAGWCVAVVGSGHAIPSAMLDLRNRTSLHVLYELLRRADLFVGLDSGPSVVAQAALTPSVVLFGTILAERRLFPAAPAIGVQGQAPCTGEHHRLPPPVQFSACSGDCMRAITVPMVMDAIKLIAP